jgi:hypothetical protein
MGLMRRTLPLAPGSRLSEDVKESDFTDFAGPD